MLPRERCRTLLFDYRYRQTRFCVSLGVKVLRGKPLLQVGAFVRSATSDGPIGGWILRRDQCDLHTLIIDQDKD
jgi:hypothetical protein